MIIKDDSINNISDEIKISVAVMAPFIILMIQYFILLYFNLLEKSDAALIQLLSKVLVGVVYLYALPSVLKRSSIKFISIYFITAFIFLLHYGIYPVNRIYIENYLFPVFFMSLPTFIYSMSIRDFTVFKKVMRRFSFIVFVFGSMIGYLLFSGSVSVDSYSMALSYYMLLPTIMFIDDFIDRFSIGKLLFTGISLFVIITFGARGPILCALVFILLKIIRPNSKLTYKRALVYSGIIGFGGLCFIYLDRILVVLNNFLLSFGIKSRSIMLFLRDEIHWSGRDRIYEDLITEVANNPLFGIGIGGDRLLRGGGYPHNIFLEILLNFGVFFGALIIISLCSLIIKLLFIKNKKHYDIFIIWLCLGFVHLMISGSFIIDLKFWVFLGISLRLIHHKRIESKIENKNYSQ